MSEPAPAAAAPTSLRLLARASKWLLGIAVAGWLAIALTALLLHGLIVPRIDQLRPWLQQRASEALGAPLVIGRITARSAGWLPSFELGDVALLDAAGHPVLQAQRVLATVSARSLWRAGLEQLYIEAPQLELRRDADGRFSLGSLNFGAGDAAASGDDAGERLADWLLAQPELLLERGSLRFDDDTVAAAPPVRLESVRLVLRNRGRRHALRLDATLPESAQQPIQLIALLREPLLHAASGRWRALGGRLFAQLPELDLPRVNAHLPALPAVEDGRAAVRLWAGLQRGRLVDATVDATLRNLRATLAAKAEPLIVPSLAGRFDWRRLPRGFEAQAQQLRLRIGDDPADWPGRRVRLLRQDGEKGQGERGELAADRIDLALLARVARSLRLPPDADAALRRVAPRGLVEALALNWQGPLDAPQRFDAHGRARAIELAAQPAAAAGPRAAAQHPGAGIPGISGANADFAFDQNGGDASVWIDGGTLTLPGMFEDPVLPITRLASRLEWQHEAGRWRVSAPDLEFANADTAGQARLEWRSSDPATAKSGSRFPGEIDLTGRIERGNLARVHRYLPLDLPAAARHYVRDALVAGSTGGAQFRVRGQIRELPFPDPARGEFTITANVRDATFAYVPRGLQPAGEPPWPPLTQVAAELRFDRAALQVGNARGRLGTGPAGLPVAAASASIANLDQPLVAVDATLRAPLPELLRTVRTTPLDGFTSGALAHARGTGDAQLRLKLALPIERLERSTVRGSLALHGNDLQVVPDSPWLRQASGTVAFSERGFGLEGVSAQLYGGPVQLEGGTGDAPRAPGAVAPGAPRVELQARGSVTAAALQAAGRDGAPAPLPDGLAQFLSGGTQYEATLRVRRAGVLDLTLTSDLRGLALALPAPLGKAADATLPLRFESGPVAADATTAPAEERLRLSLGQVAALDYRRSADGRAVRGSVALGHAALQPAAPLPAAGVDARIELARLDVDAWADALERLQQPGPGARGASAPAAGTVATTPARSYWPSRWQARIEQLDAAAFSAHRLRLQGTRSDALWRGSVVADELAGDLEFLESPGDGPGRLRARLARLALPEPGASPGTTAPAAPQPSRLPALDVVIDDFEAHGRRLGRVEIDAVNRGHDAATREWRLNRLAVRLPEAQFVAEGNWLQPAAAAAPAKPPATALDFRLEIADSGRLLARFGMPGVLRNGRGALAGRLSWNGSPLGFDAPSLDGRFHVDVDSGQFLKADPGLAKLLGVLSLQALPRRLSLDFRDLFSTGFAFDFVRGDVGITHGIAATNNLQMKGASAAVLMEGSADIVHETQDLKVVVVPEIDAGTAALVATAINPAIGLGTFLAQYFLRKPLSAAATQAFRVVGGWEDPQVTKIPRSAVQPGPAAPAVSLSGGPTQ